MYAFKHPAYKSLRLPFVHLRQFFHSSPELRSWADSRDSNAPKRYLQHELHTLHTLVGLPPSLAGMSVGAAAAVAIRVGRSSDTSGS